MVNLNDCKPGDKLISRNGYLYTYIRKTSDNNHQIMYDDGSVGIRLDNGRIFKNISDNYDVIEVSKDSIFNVTVEGEIVYVGFEDDCKKVLNILYDYYKNDKPIPSILMNKQEDTSEENQWAHGTEQAYIAKCLDPDSDINYDLNYGD